ncbi:hypothetical protein LLS1_38480 [Leifsonia sp. LS1]|uniref:GDSL-type esterase/lipase family protein n=1 Tax=Leifsonia sp. LS1 TaxID=2828483 RepID=UPI00207F48D9|nr:GDSL-type esterase/lipase family protein [Leifsonia sp. LS1]GIT82179.1 hypothetical protein LLS1_38480 [Leifsonia sp. LS1]
MLVWHASARRDWDSVAHAMDAPYAFSEGAGLDRILVLGGHTAAGFGVVTHQLGIVGSLSRQLSALTGRGTAVSACADIGMTVRSLVPRVGGLGRIEVDVVLVTVGINDSLRLTAAQSWEAHLRALIGLIVQCSDHHTPILFVEIPPARMVWDFALLPAMIATRHAVTLNDVTRKICNEHSSAVFVPFNPSRSVNELGLTRWRGEIYKEWAKDFVIAVDQALRK